MGEITLILNRMGQRDELAARQLMDCVYGELQRLARHRLVREWAAQTLEPDALVHETWLRLGGDEQPCWRNRRHFFGAAAAAMRRILIDRARRRRAERRGCGLARVALEEADAAARCDDNRVLAVDEALRALAVAAPRKAQLVELRYFIGLSLEDAARVMRISPSTAKRWWAFARAWLHEELRR